MHDVHTYMYSVAHLHGYEAMPPRLYKGTLAAGGVCTYVHVRTVHVRHSNTYTHMGTVPIHLCADLSSNDAGLTHMSSVRHMYKRAFSMQENTPSMPITCTCTAHAHAHARYCLHWLYVHVPMNLSGRDWNWSSDGLHSYIYFHITQYNHTAIFMYIFYFKHW